ncbi:DUF1858 domain-containing protein, partial [Candidatus Woesearchaeota archaeon]|nr:DUF1858 domain-containing protein [Candidatus Woesearchaeota archaeon]
MITKQTKIGEVLQKYGEKAAKILMENGMGCVGCPGAQAESIEAGCKAHGLSDEDVEKVVKG